MSDATYVIVSVGLQIVTAMVVAYILMGGGFQRCA